MQIQHHAREPRHIFSRASHSAMTSEEPTTTLVASFQANFRCKHSRTGSRSETLVSRSLQAHHPVREGTCGEEPPCVGSLHRFATSTLHTETSADRHQSSTFRTPVRNPATTPRLMWRDDVHVDSTPLRRRSCPFAPPTPPLRRTAPVGSPAIGEDEDEGGGEGEGEGERVISTWVITVPPSLD